jgi:membrane glycosyltransferase
METALGLLLIAGLASGLVSTWLIPIAASLVLAVPLSALSAVPVSRLLPSKLRMNNPTSLREPAIARRARIERQRIDTLLRGDATATAK